MTEFCNTEINFFTPDKFQKYILSKQINGICLILSKKGEERWDLKKFILELSNKVNQFIRIKDIPINPTPNDIQKALTLIGYTEINTLLAIGGGSAIDLAKGISAFYSHSKIPSEKEILNAIKEKSYSGNLEIIAVPTTAGTGSEVTQWATIWDPIHKEKYSIDKPTYKPKEAIIVPEFTLTLPKLQTLSTGLDALSHAIEAFWSKYTNPLVQNLALQSINIIVNTLRKTLDSPNDIEARRKMLCGSLLAGLAFSQTRTTACHAISYPLTLYYNIPHGLAVALTLPTIFEINKGHYENEKELSMLFNKYGNLKDWIEYVSDSIIKISPKTFNIDNIEIIVEKAIKNGRINNNPIDINSKDIYDIFDDVSKML